MAKVDRDAIEAAMRRIEKETWSGVDMAVQIANANASKDKKVGSASHHSMVVSGASEGYRLGLEKMVDVVRDYAGWTAPEHVDLVVAAADRVKDRLSEAHESRLNALGGKFSEVAEKRPFYIGNFKRALTDARDAAVSDLKHTLPDPQDALSWWARHSRDIQLGLVNAVIAAIVSARSASKAARRRACSGVAKPNTTSRDR